MISTDPARSRRVSGKLHHLVEILIRGDRCDRPEDSARDIVISGVTSEQHGRDHRDDADGLIDDRVVRVPLLEANASSTGSMISKLVYSVVPFPDLVAPLNDA